MKVWAKQKQTGFTIVELLIVIVVIGILAAITIVAFNGIQNRANNLKVVSIVESYVTALRTYAVDHGSYPTMTSCLGTGYQDQQCHADGGMYAENNSNFNSTELKPYMSSIPGVKSIRSPISGKWVDTAFYTVNNASYNATGSAIAFAQYGVSSCPSVGGLRELSNSPTSFTDGSGVWCRFALDL
jgi:general secretion pathway protein G